MNSPCVSVERHVHIAFVFYTGDEASLSERRAVVPLAL